MVQTEDRAMQERDGDKILRIRRIIDDLDRRVEEAGMRDDRYPTLLSIRNQIAAVLGDYPQLTRDPNGNISRD
jgi:hypothetical protein